MERIKSRLDTTEEKIGELQDGIEENIQNEAHRKKQT
jgi:hypothetical protein